jgi:branched-chain amino acid transport system permease protein
MLVNILNLATAGFMAIGAYISGALMLHIGLSFWFAFIVGGLTAGVFAAIFGSITIRLRGAYFILCSIALSEIIRTCFNTYMVDVFGGANGLIGIPTPTPFLGLTFELGSLSLYYLIALISILCVFAVYKIEKGHCGFVFKSLHQSIDLSESIGINTFKYKLTAFVIGSFFSGIAGSLFASFNSLVVPIDFDFNMMLFVLISVVIGGRDQIGGAVAGVALLLFLGELLRSYPQFEQIIWGFCIIIVLQFAPKGFIGVFSKKRLKTILSTLGGMVRLNRKVHQEIPEIREEN